ncbi:MAG: YihY/virulence factor BrkB family protein [Flavobacteriales bacterium]|nr:YihY/virulence factor BrkB family protein [Flavobacteriales bacterium]
MFDSILIRIKEKLDAIKIPFWQNISLLNVLRFYFDVFKKADLIDRAKAISWSLFLSFFPFLIFTFSLVPYMPHFGDLKNRLYQLVFYKFLPYDMASQLQTLMEEQILENFTFQPISLVLTLYFSTNGFYALMQGFETKNYKINDVNPFQRYFISLVITLVVVFSILIGLSLLYYTEVVWRYIELKENLQFLGTISGIGGALFGSVLFVLGVVMLYYIGSNRTLRIRQCFPGSVIAYFFAVFMISFFAYYIQNFTKYNVLYGSLGIAFVLMLWIYFSVLVILVGYEINVVIAELKRKRLARK